jgi:hypothetical protein
LGSSVIGARPATVAQIRTGYVGDSVTASEANAFPGDASTDFAAWCATATGPGAQVITSWAVDAHGQAIQITPSQTPPPGVPAIPTSAASG